MFQIANATGQAGIYRAGSPNYVVAGAGSLALPGRITFAARATASNWASSGDLTSVRIEVDDDNWQVWIASWTESNEHLEQVSLEDSHGTIADESAVSVYMSVTEKAFKGQFPRIIATATADGGESSLIVPVTTGFARYDLMLEKIVLSAGGFPCLKISIDGGLSYIAANYNTLLHYAFGTRTGSVALTGKTTGWWIKDTATAIAPNYACGRIGLFGLIDDTIYPQILGEITGYDGTNFVEYHTAGRCTETTDRVTHLAFGPFNNSGTIAAAQLTLVGYGEL